MTTAGALGCGWHVYHVSIQKMDVVTVCVLTFSSLLGRVLLCSPGCSWTHDSPALASAVWGSETRIIIQTTFSLLQP